MDHDRHGAERKEGNDYPARVGDSRYLHTGVLVDVASAAQLISIGSSVQFGQSGIDDLIRHGKQRLESESAGRADDHSGPQLERQDVDLVQQLGILRRRFPRWA